MSIADSASAPQSELPPVVTSIIAKIPEWTHARSIQVAPLQEVVSLNNTSYRVIVDDQPYVLRVAAETTHWLGVRRTEEGAAARAAAHVGVAPPIVYFDDAGNMVTPFIQGREWQPEEFHDPANLARVIETLQRLHAVKQVPANGSVFRRIEHLIASATTLGCELPAGLDHHLRALYEIEAQRKRDTRFRPGLTHNDFWANNFLDDGERLWLVDWEFSGDGDGLFDVATLTLTSRSTDDQSAAILAMYGYTAPDDFAQLQSMIYVVWFFEAMWSLVQHGLRGVSEYDYQAHTQRMFQRMQAWLDARS